MPIKFDSASSNSGNSAASEALPAGTYQLKLESITITLGKDFEDPNKVFPVARIKWVDADGDAFYDSFIRIPLGFKLNEKAAWTNRMQALVGRPLKDEDGRKFLLDLGDSINSYDDLLAAVKQQDGKNRVEVKALEFDGESLIGKEALLTLSVNAKGYNKCAASGASPLPSAKPKKVANPFAA